MSNKGTNESMVFYLSSYKAAELMFSENAELWREAVSGLLEYGFSGTEPQSDNPLLAAFWALSIPSVRGARERYALAKEYGSRGGRPSNITDEQILKLKAAGKTNKEIAEELGCSESNIENRITRHNRREDERNAVPMGCATLESLTSDQLRDIIRALKNRVKYKSIQFQYQLKEPVTGETLFDCERILRARSFLGQG